MELTKRIENLKRKIREETIVLVQIQQQIKPTLKQSTSTIQDQLALNHKDQSQPSRSEVKKEYLMDFYQQSLGLKQQEAKQGRQLLSCIQRLRSLELRHKLLSSGGDLSLCETLELLENEAKCLPFYIEDVQQQPIPALVGCVPLGDGESVPAGSMVVGYVPANKEWLLWQVMRVRMDRYGKEKYILDQPYSYELRKGLRKKDKVKKDLLKVHRNKIIPLPKHKADHRRHPSAVFQPGALVLAMFPRTTAFYEACVLKTPCDTDDNYSVTYDLDTDFDLESFDQTVETSITVYSISQRYVVAKPVLLQ